MSNQIKKEKQFKLSLLLIILIFSANFFLPAVYAYSTGDDYPSKYKNKALDAVVDEWNFYNRECTSFVAWCLNSRNGVAFTNQYSGASRWGNAKTWGTVASSLGISVNKNPAVGSVAWWNTGEYGHVAWVKEVNGSNIVIDEYNWSVSGGYGERKIAASSVTGGFIHIKDIAVEKPTIPTLSNVTVNAANVTVSWNASSGAAIYTVDFCKVVDSTYNHDYYDTSDTKMTKTLTDGQYAIRVGAKNSAGESGFTSFYYIDVITNPVVVSFDANGGELEKTKARIICDSVNGGRGENQLVLYTNGNTNTGTNSYGLEIIVSQNKVIDIIDHIGNATVPVGGFVVSAHGEKQCWLQDNVEIGDYINYHSQGDAEELWIWTENAWITWTKKVALGSTYGKLPTPLERDGYVFKGWFTSAEGGTKITSETKAENTNTQMLYAQWEQKAITNITDSKIVVENAKGRAGSTVDVTVSIENNPGIISMLLNVDYDKNALTLTGVADAGVLGNSSHSDNFAATPYSLYWSNGTATQDYTTNGIIATLTFTINNDTVCGDYPITVSYDIDNIFNYEFDPVSFNTENGKISVISFLYGDVNGDEKITLKDDAFLARYLAHWIGYDETTVDLDAADVNADSKITAKDNAILARYLAKWIGYDELPYVR